MEPSAHDIGSHFAEACQEFFYLCDGGLRDEDERIFALRVAMATIGYLAYQLPDIPVPHSADDEEDPDERKEEVALNQTYEDVRMRLEESFPNLVSYWEVLNPWDTDKAEPDVGATDAIDDMTELYLELDAGVLSWRRGEYEWAIRTWREGFHEFWGEHLMSLQRALYFVDESQDDTPILE